MPFKLSVLSIFYLFLTSFASLHSLISSPTILTSLLLLVNSFKSIHDKQLNIALSSIYFLFLSLFSLLINIYNILHSPYFKYFPLSSKHESLLNTQTEEIISPPIYQEDPLIRTLLETSLHTLKLLLPSLITSLFLYIQNEKSSFPNLTYM